MAPAFRDNPPGWHDGPGMSCAPELCSHFSCWTLGFLTHSLCALLWAQHAGWTIKRSIFMEAEAEQTQELRHFFFQAHFLLLSFCQLSYFEQEWEERRGGTAEVVFMQIQWSALQFRGPDLAWNCAWVQTLITNAKGTVTISWFEQWCAVSGEMCLKGRRI